MSLPIKILLGVLILLLLLFITWLFLKRRFLSKKLKVLKKTLGEMEQILNERYSAVSEFIKLLEEKSFSTEETKSIAINLMYATSSGDLNLVAASNVQISNKLKTIFENLRSNNDLSNDDDVTSEMNIIGEIENDLAVCRKNYNAIVREYNCECKIFPAVIAAKIFRYKQYPFFAADVSVQDIM